MANRFRTFGIGVRNSTVVNGGLTIQPIVPEAAPGTASGPGPSAPGLPAVRIGGGATGASGTGAVDISASGRARPGVVGAIRAGGLTLPIDSVPAVRFVPPSAHLIKETYPIDVLNVAQTRLENGQFVPITDGGIVPFRPEILGIFDFSPIYRIGSRRRNNSVGDFIDVQYQASHLRQETLLKLVQRIQRNSTTTNSDDAFKRIREEYSAELRQVEANVSYLQDIITNINNIKTSLEIKKIPSSFYNTTSFLALEDFFLKKMQFSKAQFAGFSDTKILLQMLFDLRSILESYSVSLLDLKDPDREGDVSPVRLDKTYTTNNGFSFTLGNLRSVTTPINATGTGFFNQFLNSLPQSPDDRIRILTTLLGKEYLVSRGLGRTDLQRLLQGFNISNTGNPFDNIIGTPGDTIFERPKGQDSLSSLMFIDPGIPNANVLPFENKHVDSDDQSFVYVPGSAYFIDTILSTQGGSWNTGPYNSFVNLYNNRLKDARTIIEEFLSLRNLRYTLVPVSISDICMISFKNSVSTLTEPANVSGDQAMISALFKLASTDPELKLMLFQFSILIGMAVNGATEQREVFDVLAKSEISSLRAMSKLEIPSGVEPNPSRGQAVIKPYIEQLADAIENRVVALTSRNFSELSRFRTNVDFIQTLRPFRSSFLSPALSSSPLTTSLLGSVAFSSAGAPKKEQSVGVHLQRGNIARILKNLTAGGGDNKTNLIEEFVGVATNLFAAAQIQGANVHLLQDGTNRSRYNFLSISTQLLMLFEIFSSYASRYAFASFEKTFSRTESLITVDTIGNKAISIEIDNIAKRPLLTNIRPAITAPITSNVDAVRNALGVTLPSAGTTIEGTSLAPQVGVPFVPAGTQSSRTVSTTDSAVRTAPYRGRASTSATVTVTATVTGTRTLSDTLRGVIDSFGNLDRVRQIIRESDKYYDFKFSLFANRKKIEEETMAVANALHILAMVGKHLKNGSDRILPAFNQARLEAFLRIQGENGIAMVRNPAQTRTANYILQTIKDKAPTQDYNSETGYVYNNFVVSDVTTLEEYRCLRALLAENPYINSTMASPSENKRVKLLSVGIPTGFSKQLADRVNLGEININSFKDKEFDVVTVNVYKRDARFDDLVFKPQRFLFDLSLFVLESDIKNIVPGADEAFTRMMERAKVTDYTDFRNPRKLGVSNIRDDERYNFLTEDERKVMIHSHVSSYLLGLYINFITGVRITEDTFLQGASPGIRNLNPQMQQIVFTYLRDVLRQSIPGGQSIDRLLQNRSISEDAKDIIRLFDYGSIVFNEKEITSRVLAPKLFDRLFHIPLNIEEFEIDFEKTVSTESGRKAWSQTYLQEKIVLREGRYFLKPRPKNELIFEDYFVAIETVNDREPV